MHKLTSLKTLHVLFILSFSLNTNFALAKYSGGDGSPENPWRISTKDDLLALSQNIEDYDDKYFVMTNDIDLAGEVYTTALIGANSHCFFSNFDGNDFKIINLTIDNNGQDCLGFFGDVAEGKIKNLGIENANITGNNYVGCLIGLNFGSVISDCYSSGNIISNGEYVGGLIGGNLWGSNPVCATSNCYSNVNIRGTGQFVGGLIGKNQGITISNCFSNGSVYGYFSVGGLAGRNEDSDIRRCYSTGNINGEYYIGGLIGDNYKGIISECYSVSDVNGQNFLAGLVGNNDGEVINSFWNIEKQSHGVAYGTYGTAINIVALTTSQMQRKSTYCQSNWNFIKVWGIIENQTYPFLKQYTSFEDNSWSQGADLNKDGIVNYKDLNILSSYWLASNSNAPNITWITINDPGIIGHLGFNGQMSKYEISNAQYCQFLNDALSTGDISPPYANGTSGTNAGKDFPGQMYYYLFGEGWGTDDQGASKIRWASDKYIVEAGFENYPVTYVSWYGATAFCNYYGWRLPTQGEWQAVADYDGTFTYGCGTTLDPNIANYRDSVHPYGTTPVGAFGDYGYGMADLAGNVWEWTSSEFGDGQCIICGGSWLDSYNDCSVSYSYHNSKAVVAYCYGFRVCR